PSSSTVSRHMNVRPSSGSPWRLGQMRRALRALDGGGRGLGWAAATVDPSGAPPLPRPRPLPRPEPVPAPVPVPDEEQSETESDETEADETEAGVAGAPDPPSGSAFACLAIRFGRIWFWL